jgi:hypothetical protein
MSYDGCGWFIVALRSRNSESEPHFSMLFFSSSISSVRSGAWSDNMGREN